MKEMQRTLPWATIAQLRSIYSVERVLRSRGIEVANSSGFEPTLFNRPDPEPQLINQFYECFSVAQNRKNILDFIEKRTPSNSILTTFPELSGLTFERQRFSTSFEWFVGELLVRQFQSFSSSFGVVVKNLSDSIDLPDIGDFDAISVMGDGNLLYVECKSGATDAEQIVKAVRRGRLIGSAATVIALSGKTGNFSILKSLLSLQQHPELHHPTTVFDMTSINLPDSTAIIWGNTYFLPLASANLSNSLSTILRLIGQQRAGNYLHSLIGSAPFTAETQEMFRTMGFRIELPFD